MRKESGPWIRLLRGTPNLVIALVMLGLAAGFLAFVVAVAYTVVTSHMTGLRPSDWAVSDWMTVVAVGFLFVTLARVVLMFLVEIWGTVRESAAPMAQSVSQIREQRDARVREDKGREEKMRRQGGALSVSQDVDGGELTEVTLEQGSLEAVEVSVES